MQQLASWCAVLVQIRAEFVHYICILAAARRGVSGLDGVVECGGLARLLLRCRRTGCMIGGTAPWRNPDNSLASGDPDRLAGVPGGGLSHYHHSPGPQTSQ